MTLRFGFITENKLKALSRSIKRMFALLMLSTMKRKLSGIKKYFRTSKMILISWFSMRFLTSMRSSLLDYLRRMQSIRLSIINSKCLHRNSSSISRSNPLTFWASKRIFKRNYKTKMTFSCFWWDKIYLFLKILLTYYSLLFVQG